VSEGKGPNCLQETKATPDTTPTQETKATQETKPAKPVKSKSVGSRRSPSFLRRVDLFLQGRR
jgi:hypothetical protein